jgi:hypothetical protein
MRALICLTALALVLSLCASYTVQAGDIDHQYGVELRGGYSMYLDNADPNAFVKGFSGTQGYTQTEYTESVGAITGGISLLYKSEDYFGWHIGLNVLGTDSATAIASQAGYPDQVGRVFTNTTELFVTANYYWHLLPAFNIQIGGGPAFYLANLDLETSPEAAASYGGGIYGAHGRTFGFTGNLGAELFLSGALSLRFGGGFRWAPVTRFKYFREVWDENGVHKEGETVYWTNPDGTSTYDTFEVDFSGAFAEIGLRIYFEPAAKWKKY